MNRFVSIDASTNSVAFSVFSNDSLEFFGKILFEGKTPYEKLLDASRKLEAFSSQLGDFSFIVIEQPVHINSPKTLSDLAIVHGGIVASLSSSAKVRVASVPPIAWQAFIKNGRLVTAEKQKIRKDFPGKTDSWYKKYERVFRKQRTIDFVVDRYDRQITDDDIADAVAIGHYAVFNWDKLFGTIE
jgi:hypothetical protein